MKNKRVLALSSLNQAKDKDNLKNKDNPKMKTASKMKLLKVPNIVPQQPNIVCSWEQLWVRSAKKLL